MEAIGEMGALFGAEQMRALMRAVVMLGVGILIIRVVMLLLRRFGKDNLPPQHYMLVSRVTYYALVLLVGFSVLHQFGFKVSVLLGAAGILTVAIGFASQTSASNLISGLFLIAERPFVVGNFIRVGEVVGEVLSVDLLSVKLRTPDNLYVRVPNETLIKSNIVNLSHFPIRRLDLLLDIAYKEDLGRVYDALVAAAESNHRCLVDPAPQMIFQGFGDSSLKVQFSVWAARENFLEMRNTLPQQIRTRFAEDDIEIPYPRRTLTGSETEPPLRIQLVSEKPAGS